MRLLPLVLTAALALPAPAAEVRPADLLPKDVKYDPAVPTPRKALGFDVGERHLQHHQVVGYMRQLAKASPRVVLVPYGRTFGGRPLLALIVTSPENHKRLEEVRKQHVALADAKSAGAVKLEKLPAVIWMGYNVHGNEPSAGNAAVLVAYHLAAATGEAHEKLLREAVILLDPCLNPDGFERFASWANDNRGRVASDDPETREHREAWPGGRGNYYSFDLNRDWLPAQMPESRGRLALYHRWRPNLVLDFHEMGPTQTYFFQPGAARQVHPLIPAKNQELTRALAKHHGKALDKLGSLYFTGELFDDFYPGKGSTYPDLHGGVGILFEQASSRGQVQETPNGRLTFPFTIRNQFATSLSSLRGLVELRPKLLELKRDFYLEAPGLAKRSEVKAHVVSAPGDPARLRAFLDVLHRHEIRAYRLEKPLVIDGKGVGAPGAYVVPVDQPEARFVEALFETRTKFEDNTFYDVSAWTLPLAFGLGWERVKAAVPAGHLGEAYRPGPVAAHAVTFAKDDVGYALDWRDSTAPRAVYQLLSRGVLVRVATKPFRARIGGELRAFGHGTVVVPVGPQAAKRGAIVEVLQKAAGGGTAVFALREGDLAGGPGLGSASFLPVPRPRVLLVVGEGTSAYDAGEVWHLLDQRLGVPVTRVEGARLGGIELGKYTLVVLPGGTYAGVPVAAAAKLKEYVSQGGTVFAVGTAIGWLNARGVVEVPLRRAREVGGEEGRPYGRRKEDAAERLVRGAIFRAKVDATHPMAFGLGEGEPLYLCRTTTVVLDRAKDAYSTPVVYEEGPVVAGYASARNQRLVSGSAGVAVVGVGKGRAVLMPDNPNFRAYWRGSERVFVNGVFFGPVVKTGE